MDFKYEKGRIYLENDNGDVVAEIEYEETEEKAEIQEDVTEVEAETNDAPRHRRRKDRFGHRGFNRGKHSRNRHREHNEKEDNSSKPTEPVILYNSHEDIPQPTNEEPVQESKGKKTWWKKLIKS